MCVLQGNYDYEGREEEIFCAIVAGNGNSSSGIKKSTTKLSEHIGLLPISDGFASRFGTDTRRERKNVDAFSM